VVASGSAQMFKEIELKLEFDPADAARIKSAPILAAESLGRPEEQNLVSTYFDTPSLALSKAGVFLRVRELDGR
jgi:triphosphatase